MADPVDSTVRASLEADREQLNEQLAEMDGAAHDENFADSGQVAAEQGERARTDRVRLMALQPAPLGGDVRGVGCRPDDLAPAIAEPGNQLIVLDDRPAVAVQDRRP